MNCGTCRECKIKIWVFENFGFSKFPFFKKQLEVEKNNKNTNCGTCRECKIKNWVFENFEFLKFSDFFFRFLRKCFGFWGVFVKEIVIVNIGFGFLVLNSIW